MRHPSTRTLKRVTILAWMKLHVMTWDIKDQGKDLATLLEALYLATIHPVAKHYIQIVHEKDTG